MRLLPYLALTLLALTACKDKPKFVPPQDAGPICDGTTQLVNGECRFVCQRDGDCMSGERCNLFTGQCEMKPPPPDAGPPPPTCTNGAVRCSADKKSIETCMTSSTWQATTMCPPPGGFCQNERCLTCQPGASTCVPGQPTQLTVCLDDGSATRNVTCSGSATCQANECRECTPNTYRCSTDMKAVQQCQKTNDETATWKWVSVGDNFDGNCITQQCRVGGTNGFECVAPACFPGQINCKDARTAQTCNATGGYVDQACTATQECQAGVCVDECADAVAARSYFGCDYWTAVQDNGVDAPFFKANTTTGQGTADSKYALVVTNRSVNAAQVTITRFTTSVQTVKTVTVPGRNDAATKGLVVVYLPWASVGDDNDFSSVSGIKRFGYRLQSTKPITVYQFNPLDPSFKQGNCASVSSCNLIPSGSGQQCISGTCNYFSFSNDASLLLPAHILGLSYVAMTPEHILRRSGSTSGAPLSCTAPTQCAKSQTFMLNGHITIVGTQDNTMVTVHSNARTKAGPGVVSIAKNGTQVFTINTYDVLQIASDNPSPTPPSVNVECADDPFDQLCIPGFSCNQLCRVDNNLTGSIITADKPIATFGGSYCTFRGYKDSACDHVEEQLFPFVTWGKTFVAQRTPPLRLTSGAFASAANAGPDYYQIVAGCPSSVTACQNGTLITLSTPPAGIDVLAPNRCATGSLSTNNCRLMGGQYVEFRSKASFTITADQPIQVGQFFAGQDATTGTTRPDEGDPSFVLLPPIEQWRNNYTVLTAPNIRDNYVGLVIDSSKVMTVSVDNAAVSTGWSTIPNTTFQVVNVPVPSGTHVISVLPKPGQTTVPGAGVLVFGFDSYVSYGYTGGLDLQSIVTGINPGG